MTLDVVNRANLLLMLLTCGSKCEPEGVFCEIVAG
jgi:hypothetical protein